MRGETVKVKQKIITNKTISNLIYARCKNVFFLYAQQAFVKFVYFRGKMYK